MQSFQAEVLPLLISQQFNGVEATFGPTALKDERNGGQLQEVLRKMDTPFEDGGGVHKISTMLGMYALEKAGGGLRIFVYNKVVNGMNHPLGEESGNQMDPSLPSSSSSQPPPPKGGG
jgi:hypothetical protein